MSNKGKRYLEKNIFEDLRKKMVFIGGPRQVGKTTLSLKLLSNTANETHPAYFNWDSIAHRAIIKSGELPLDHKLIIFDEIHKYPKWKSLIKGYYDTMKSHTRFIITGSARLDTYRKGGDSLLGRYHYYRLHPLSISELNISSKQGMVDLLNLSGFPEPFLSGSQVVNKRWQKERLERIVYEDIRDLENLKQIQLIEDLANELPRRVAAPLSIKSLKEELGVAHETAESWVRILETVYYCFRILPFGGPKIRAVKKEQKLYLWDWSLCESEGARFENLVASHLLKYCHFIEDTQGSKMELRFLRTKELKEIDFVILKDRRPLFAVECKTGEKQVSPTIKYFKGRTSIPQYYQVHLGERSFIDANTGTKVMPFWKFCSEVGIP